jgi:hypothetical protein
MKLLSKLLLALVLGLSMASVTSACPLCKDGIPEADDGTESNHDPDRLSRAYNISIYVLLGLPYVLGGSVGIWLYRGYKRKKNQSPKLETL